ncbi:MAG: hypothetical protein COB69_07985 [Phycisphaera sp.]|nr:MAG: hypothetical protein COB69_07985 [Phycisphaera sp.]
MSDFQRSIRAACERHSPAIVFGARLGRPDELPLSMREQADPWSAWSAQAAESLGTAVEITGSQRLGKEGTDDSIAVLAGLRLAYMKLVSDMADGMNIPEGELHNRINETLNSSQMEDKLGDSQPGEPHPDDDNPMFDR